MKTADFDFDLPRELIAQHPANPRDSARLLVIAEERHDRRVLDLPALLRPGDVLVCNDTRVVPTRLRGRRLSETGPGARIEATLHRDIGKGAWKAFARPARKLKVGNRIVFEPSAGAAAAGTPVVGAEVVDKGADGEVTLDFGCSDAEVLAAIERIGAMPLPPYIQRETPQADDSTDYQTIFAERPGAVAAPTAGLHFTRELLHDLERRGIECVTITLHVGAGTFLPVKAERIEAHRMHAEWVEVTAAAATAIETARTRGGRVIAVGTTSLRSLESAADDLGRIRPFRGDTDIFIYPGYRFQAVDMLLTNFHLPRSTLFMLVSAFAGRERMLAAYGHAMAEGYRFYSYGDACLLERAA